jgi:hypothetical protein
MTTKEENEQFIRDMRKRISYAEAIDDDHLIGLDRAYLLLEQIDALRETIWRTYGMNF